MEWQRGKAYNGGHYSKKVKRQKTTHTHKGAATAINFVLADAVAVVMMMVILIIGIVVVIVVVVAVGSLVTVVFYLNQK